MTGICNRTLHNLIDHLACTLNDLEGTELRRIAEKSADYNPDVNGYPDGIDYTFEAGEEELNHIRWSEKFLTSVINDGFRILHLERPDLFSTTIRMLLKPGCNDQDLPDDCLKFNEKLENSTNCDTTHSPNSISDAQIKISRNLEPLFCTTLNASKDYEVMSFNFDPKNSRQFTVTPVPPSDEATYVTLSCVGPPPCYTWSEDADTLIGEGTDDNPMLDIYEPWLIEYALYRAFMTDRESQTSEKKAGMHWDNGFKLIADGRTADYMYYHPDLFLKGPIKEGTGENIVQSQ